MANYASLLATIAANITDNNTGAITGPVLKGVLDGMVGSLGTGYQFMGVAATSTNPGTPDQKVYYLAGPGTYTNFNNITVADGEIAVLKYDSAWSKVSTPMASAAEVSQLGLKVIGNKFIPNATNPAQVALQELYLTGLNSAETYYVSQFRTNASGKIRLYIAKASDGSVVALSEFSVSAGEVGVIGQTASSGIRGYFVSSLAGANVAISQDATTGVINQVTASSINENPAIKAYLIETGNVTIANLVKYTSQSLTDAQKTQARTNIGAASSQETDIESLADIAFFQGYGDSSGHIVNNNKYLYSSPIYGSKTIHLPQGFVFTRINYYNISDGTFVSTLYISPISVYSVQAVEGCYAIVSVKKSDNSVISPYDLKNSIILTEHSESIKRNTADIKDLKNANTPYPLYVKIIEGMNINYQTGEELTLNGNAITDYLPISLNVGVSVKYAGSSASYVRRYYNASKEIQSSATGAVYFRFSMAGYDADKFVITMDGKDYTSKMYYRNLTENDMESLNKSQLSFDVADGKIDAPNTYEGELEASPIKGADYAGCVGFVEGERFPKSAINNRIVAVNHDDFPENDLTAVRKIYNKYRMNANFNFILTPFGSVDAMASRVENVKKMQLDGNEIGLHAILGKSYWWMNKLFDLTPDGGSTFAPTITDLQGPNADHTGTNAFGSNITLTTKASEAGYATIPSSVEDAVIVSLTQAQLQAINRCYSIYGDYAFVITGLDLDGNSVSKNTIQWLEYWYNELIDDSLGYSSTDSSASARFAEDYDDPTKYPDAVHLANGKMVHYSDTSNPHYNDADYQKVGKFTKGLFKGSFSACNYEVTDRCIEVAQAFFRHYYGGTHFTNFGRHGVGFFSRYWTDSSGYHWANSAETLLLGEGGLFYHSRMGKWMSQYDILDYEGIRMTNHQHPLSAEYIGQKGLYSGAVEAQGGKFNFAEYVNYLNFFGNGDSGNPTISYDDFKTFISGVDDWLKFAFENAGQSVTRNGKTFSVFAHLKQQLQAIVSTLGTGKVPAFSLDTIKLDPSINQAVDMMLRMCYRLGMNAVPMGKAREIANLPDARKNYFANPAFKQSILKMFGGSSTSVEAYIPDGWQGYAIATGFGVSVENATINGIATRAMTISSTGSSQLRMRIFGMPSGHHKISLYVKRTGTDSKVGLYLLRNRSTAYSTGDVVDYITPTSEWSLQELEFDIPAMHQNEITLDSPISQICRGYEDNVACVMVRLDAVGGSISLAMPYIS